MGLRNSEIGQGKLFSSHSRILGPSKGRRSSCCTETLEVSPIAKLEDT
jgi:hypothetical protein